MKLLAAIAFWLIALSACTLAPHYDRPAAPVPARWTQDAISPAGATPAPELGWRQFFPDPAVQRLIALALANNRDLRVAVLNVQAAQAQYRIQRADLFPTIAANAVEEIEEYPAGVIASSSGGSASAGAAPIRGGQTIRFFQAGVGFTSYELDLFGKIRSLDRAALERYFGY